jgi:hypothetical protein
MTATAFKSKAEKLFLDANPTATITGWVAAPRYVRYPTGVKGIIGKFHVVAEGHAPKVITADWDDVSGWMVK